MKPIETYLRDADELTQQTINAWGQNVAAGNAALLTEDFKALLEKACQYKDAQRVADNRREFKVLTEGEAAAEKVARLAFAQAYKTYWEKREAGDGHA